MHIEKHVRAVGEHDAPLAAHSGSRKHLDLLKEAGQVGDHAVSNDALALGVKDARGHLVQSELLPGVIVNGVTGVGATLATCNNIIPLRDDVDQLALALVAPLGAEDRHHLRQSSVLVRARLGTCCSDAFRRHRQLAAGHGRRDAAHTLHVQTKRRQRAHGSRRRTGHREVCACILGRYVQNARREGGTSELHNERDKIRSLRK
mmetsp:Transcript_16243/g.27382  ORF Transcript_16243/g.27382 Transcript_16243/m.27382 type:complete len:204 (-) Transcript_16243:66-677(-)